MTTYKDFKENFEEGIMRLTTGVAKLSRRRSKNWYQTLKDVANAFAGGSLPSLDPNISDVKSRTNIYSGPEEMNRKARGILGQTASEYNTIYRIHFDKFYTTSESIMRGKRGENFSFDEEFSSDQTLDRIKSLFDRLNVSDDMDGLISSEAPRNLVIEIFKEMTIVINNLKDSVNENISSIKSISIDLDNDEFSDRLEAPLLSVCNKIYIFKLLTSSFTMLQEHRRKSRRERALLDPSRSRRVDSEEVSSEETSTEDSETPTGSSLTFEYSGEQLLLGPDSALDDLGGDYFRVQNLDRSGVYNIPIVLTRTDGKQITDEEIVLINDDPQRFTAKLINLGVLEMQNIDAATLIRNSAGGTASTNRNRSTLTFNIKLNEAFKTEAYNEVSNDNDPIFRVMDIDAVAPIGTIIKASLKDNFKKEAETSTTPFYETISPSGEKVTFTPTDLVKGMGKLKDSSGKSFKPGKVKGKSLSHRVMSRGFGKVRK